MSEREKCENCIKVASNTGCFGGLNDAQELHTCPYKEEEGGENEALCNCCEDCVAECADSI
jgi:hypothetical protein